MRYEETIRLSEREFRRLTGVKRTSFAKMAEILTVAEVAKRRKGGHKSKLPMEDKLLLTLEYLREYRTYFHIVQDFGIHETSAIRISRWVEEILIKDGTFSLPGRKALLKSDVEYEVILVDATESPIERPQKNSENITPARKNTMR
jgi:hypothetical protein